MLFSSQVFIFIFAPLAIAVYWLIPQRYRLGWLVVASYMFYGYWDWRFCGLMIAVTCFSFAAARRIEAAKYASVRRGWLIAAIAANASLLGYFKYAGFLATTLNAVGRFLHAGGPLPVPEMLFPVGISFYVFEAISYTVDVYRRQVKATASLLHFAGFISLFPHLVAGPIMRWRQLGPQLAAIPERLDMARLNLGLCFFAAGLTKKVLIADRLAYFADPLWLDFRHLAPGEAWAATLGYTLQIYFDFSGYSLMAIGLGHLLGLSLPQNFNSPYRATDIADFWRRWHMTLSAWIRDYLFFPLGGMHKLRRWAALFIAMLLAGLWHGAAWTFVIWGGYHGLLLVIHHALRELKLRFRAGWPGRFGMLFLVMLGWVVFRSNGLPMALSMLRTMFSVGRFGETCSVPSAFFAIAIPALLWAVFAPNTYELLHVRQARPRAWALAALGVLAAVAVLLLSDSSPFLYYQF